MALLETARRAPSLAVAALLVLAAFAPALPAQGPEELEYQVKAAFLYNFTKFVEWPAEAFANERSPIVLCVAGEDRLGRSLEVLVRGETVGGRSLAVDRVTAGDSRACHLLFVGRSESGRFSRILDGVQGGDVLTVGEAPGFLEAGGLVNFVMDKGKVRFAIHPAAAERSRLKISSKLMRLAINAREGAG